MSEAEEKLREQIDKAIDEWTYGARIKSSLTLIILNFIKEAGYLPVQPIQLEVLSDEGMKSVIKENIALLNHEERSVELLFKVSQDTAAHNEAKFGQLYRIKPG